MINRYNESWRSIFCIKTAISLFTYLVLIVGYETMIYLKNLNYWVRRVFTIR